MPIYEYRCNACSKEFEVMQKLSDKQLKGCIYCSSKNIEKIMSQSSFALKGSGWYKTDYAAKKACDTGTDKKDDKKSPCANCPSAG